MDIKEIVLKVAMDTGLYLDGANQSEPLYVIKPEEVVEFATALLAEVAKQNEPVAINEPNYHYEAMGCGLEDRRITDRYEAMEYGWYCAIERMFEQLPEDQLYTLPITAEQIANETAEAIARMLENGSFLSTESKVALAANGAAKAIRNGAWKEFKKS